jgi:TRAP-type C4-dicarboxylate transport system substrate-binding protein
VCTNRLASTIIAAAAAMASAACAGTAGSDKVGNPPQPTTLTLVTHEQLGRPGGDIVERFIAAVSELSQGRVSVVPKYDYPPGATAGDEATVDALVAGDFDMALVPARAWHSAGVTTLEPLQLPMLVESDAQANEVVSDTRLAASLLAGLDTIDVTGLGLYPEDVRRLVRLDGTPVDPSADLTGMTVRAVTADTTWAVMRGLGAEVVDVRDHEFDEGLASGRIAMMETSLALLRATAPARSRPSVLGNVALYTKFDVLAIGNESLARLDEPTTAMLRDAATRVLSETQRERTPEETVAVDVCTFGVDIVLATKAQRDALQRRLQPMVEGLIADAGIAELVEQVRNVTSRAAAPGAPACAGSSTAEREVIDAADVRPEPGALPDGIYRFAIDAETILAAYPDFPPQKLDGYAAVVTVELDGGRHTVEAVQEDGIELGFDGVYQVDADTITLTWPSGADFNVAMAIRWRWTLAADGSLDFEPLGPADMGPAVDYTDLLTIPSWERID